MSERTGPEVQRVPIADTGDYGAICSVCGIDVSGCLQGEHTWEACARSSAERAGGLLDGAVEMDVQRSLARERAARWKALAKRFRGHRSTVLDLDGMDARSNAATPGPWRSTWRDEPNLGEDAGGGDIVVEATQETDWLKRNVVGTVDWDCEPHAVCREPDAEFIAHARSDVPALTTRVRQLEADNAMRSGRIAELKKQRITADQLAAFLRSRPSAYFSDLLRPMFEMVMSGAAKNHVISRFTTHREENWSLVLQRETGKTPLEHAFEERDGARLVAAELKEALGRLVRQYESEQDADAPMAHPPWLVAALSLPASGSGNPAEHSDAGKASQGAHTEASTSSDPLVLTPESWNKVVDLIEKPGTPAPALVDLFRQSQVRALAEDVVPLGPPPPSLSVNLCQTHATSPESKAAIADIVQAAAEKLRETPCAHCGGLDLGAACARCAPVPVVVLVCPSCGLRHVDRGELARRVHTLHRCFRDPTGLGKICGHEWTVAPAVFGGDDDLSWGRADERG